MQRKIGYALVDNNGNEIKDWVAPNMQGEHAVPDMVLLPNGDAVHGLQPGPVQDWQLVEKWVDQNPPSDLHAVTGYVVSWDGQKIMSTEQYGPPSKDVIKAKLAELDPKMLRAIEEGDPVWIDQYKTQRANLRAMLQ